MGSGSEGAARTVIDTGPGPRTGGRWLRLGPAAGLLGISLNTLRRWSDAGLVPCYRSSGGHRRYDRKDLEAIPAAPLAARRSPASNAAPASSKRSSS